jgi:hypothetical protein
VSPLPIEASLVETIEAPTYRRITKKALHLSRLGMNFSQIAEALGVTDKTAAKAVRLHGR